MKVRKQTMSGGTTGWAKFSLWCGMIVAPALCAVLLAAGGCQSGPGVGGRVEPPAQAVVIPLDGESTAVAPDFTAAKAMLVQLAEPAPVGTSAAEFVLQPADIVVGDAGAAARTVATGRGTVTVRLRIADAAAADVCSAALDAAEFLVGVAGQRVVSVTPPSVAVDANVLAQLLTGEFGLCAEFDASFNGTLTLTNVQLRFRTGGAGGNLNDNGAEPDANDNAANGNANDSVDHLNDNGGANTNDNSGDDNGNDNAGDDDDDNGNANDNGDDVGNDNSNDDNLNDNADDDNGNDNETNNANDNSVDDGNDNTDNGNDNGGADDNGNDDGGADDNGNDNGV